MTSVSYQGIPGILRPFKEYLEAWSLPSGAEVVFYGVPGTCTPFVELLCYAVRSLPCKFLIVPVGVTTFSKQTEKAQKFADYAASDAGKAIFKKYGFPTYPDEEYKDVQP